MSQQLPGVVLKTNHAPHNDKYLLLRRDALKRKLVVTTPGGARKVAKVLLACTPPAMQGGPAANSRCPVA